MYLQYKKEPNRSYLIERIKEKKLSGLVDENKKITDNMLIDEHWRYWLSIDEKDHVKKIFNHPILSESDFNLLTDIVSDTKKKQAFMSFGTFTTTMIFYKLFLRKIPTFYNFFNKKHFRGISLLKSGASCFAVYWLELLGLNYIYDHRIPILIRDKGLYKKYNMKFEM